MAPRARISGCLNFEPPMKFTALKQFDLAVIVLTVMVGWYLHVSYADGESARRSQQRQMLATQQATWDQQAAVQARTDQKALLDRQNADQTEERKSLGSPLAAATKNPDFDIRQMLEQVAVACAPAGAKVVVTVDGFTEFEVAIDLPSRVAPAEITPIAWRIITNTRPYIKTLRFIVGDAVLVDLNDADIEALSK